MRYIDIEGHVIPKHCIYGPRPAEGIVFNNYEWWSITDHLVKEQREREMAAVCKAKEEAKKQLSFEMTSTWSNTLASIKTRGNQKRLERAAKEKQDKIDQYHQILKDRDEERNDFLANLRKVLFQEKDEVKTINSAVLFSTVMDGWKKQIEMKKFLKKEEARREHEWAVKIIKDAEEYEKEKLEEKRNGEKNRILKQQLDAQVAEIRKRKEEEVKKLKEQEQRDAINMRIEGEKIYHCNMVENEYRKKLAASYIKKTVKQLEYERNIALEEDEEKEINNIYEKYRKRLRKEQAEQEEKMKNKQVERRMKIAEMLSQKLIEAALKEEGIQSAIKEKDEQGRKEEEKKETARKALEGLLEEKRKAKERQAREQHKKKEEKKWEMMQQYRSAEIYEELKQAERKRVKYMNHRLKTDLDLQVKEAEERRARELKEWLEPLENESSEREELLRYCEDTMNFIKENNLPEDCVRAAILEVKKSPGVVDEEMEKVAQKRKQQQYEQQQEGRKARPLGNGCYCFKY